MDSPAHLHPVLVAADNRERDSHRAISQSLVEIELLVVAEKESVCLLQDVALAPWVQSPVRQISFHVIIKQFPFVYLTLEGVFLLGWGSLELPLSQGSAGDILARGLTA